MKKLNETKAFILISLIGVLLCLTMIFNVNVVLGDGINYILEGNNYEYKNTSTGSATYNDYKEGDLTTVSSSMVDNMVFGIEKVDTVEGYITVKKAAEILGVTVMTLHRWDAKGKLKARRHPINHYRLYTRTQLEKLLKKLSDK